MTIDPDVMASDWKLASDGEASILALLDSVEISRLERIVTSQEVKAKQTGEFLAAHLGLPLEVRPGLEEHHHLLASLDDAGVEIRPLPALTPLKDAWSTSLHVSGIRLRNAKNW